MHPPLQLGEGGGLKISEKSLLEGGWGQKFLFWRGGGGGNFVGRGGGSCNFEVKIKTA